jgi:hypothetical protein
MAEVSADPRWSEVFRVDEIAQRWKVSSDFVRRLFAHEPGVLFFRNRVSNGSRRCYTTIRVPTSVLLRVELRLQGRTTDETDIRRSEQTEGSAPSDEKRSGRNKC